MRLCSVCDKKIEGSWCKNCHRFVKTYDLPEGIHLNESHDPANDTGCTYHSYGRSSGNGDGGQTTAGKMGTAQTHRQSTAGAGIDKSAGSKTKKAVAAVIICSVIFMVLSTVVPLIAREVRTLSDDIREEFQYEFVKESKDDAPFEDAVIEPDSETEGLVPDVQSKLDALNEIEAAKITKEDGYKFRYYEPEDIKRLGFSCSEEHFDRSVAEFEAWLDKNWTTGYEIEEQSSSDYNYYYETADYFWMYFAAFRDYYATDDFAVRAGYDTGTDELHMFGFVSTAEADYTELYFKALQEFDPGTDWTKERFIETLKEALDAKEYTTFYASEVLEIDAEVKEGYFSVVFYPAYTY